MSPAPTPTPDQLFAAGSPIFAHSTLLSSGTQSSLSQSFVKLLGTSWLAGRVITIDKEVNGTGLVTGNSMINLEVDIAPSHEQIISPEYVYGGQGKQDGSSGNGAALTVQLKIILDAHGRITDQAQPLVTPKPPSTIPSTPSRSALSSLRHVPQTPRTPSGKRNPQAVKLRASAPIQVLLPRSTAKPSDILDLRLMSTPNVPNMLRTIIGRSELDNPYTNVGHTTFISLNPRRDLGLFTPEIVTAYKTGARKAPHIYALADQTGADIRMGKRQTMVVLSGDSGAGKSEGAKQIMDYICAGAEDERMKHVNVILEAMGNAVTVKNDNSSRFGKLITLHRTATGTVCRFSVQAYLLENNRVSKQAPGERNFHIFYQLIAGIDAGERSDLGFSLEESGSLSASYPYLSGDLNKTDGQLYRNFKEAMTALGISAVRQREIINTLAAIIHLGRVRLTCAGKTASISTKDTALAHVAMLTGIPRESLASIITTKKNPDPRATKRLSRGAEDVKVAIDAIAKTLYKMTFDWFISYINEELVATVPSGGQDDGYVTYLLDLFGFENFETNSLSQFCINAANEELQHMYMSLIVEKLIEEQIQDGVTTSEPKAKVEAEGTCFKAIEGVIALLNNIKSAGHANEEALLAEIQHKVDSKYVTGQKDPSMSHSNTLRIKHYNGTVEYNLSQFIQMNLNISKDETSEMHRIFAQASNGVIESFAATEHTLPTKPGMIVKTTITSEFLRSLLALKQIITGCDALYFVRCIRPNASKHDHRVDVDTVVAQLEAASVLESLQLAEMDFPVSMGFDRLKETFPSLQSNGDTLEKALVNLGVGENVFRVGKTKVFFSGQGAALLDTILLQKLAAEQAEQEARQKELERLAREKAEAEAAARQRELEEKAESVKLAKEKEKVEAALAQQEENIMAEQRAEAEARTRELEQLTVQKGEVELRKIESLRFVTKKLGDGVSGRERGIGASENAQAESRYQRLGLRDNAQVDDHLSGVGIGMDDGGRSEWAIDLPMAAALPNLLADDDGFSQAMAAKAFDSPSSRLAMLQDDLAEAHAHFGKTTLAPCPRSTVTAGMADGCKPGRGSSLLAALQDTEMAVADMQALFSESYTIPEAASVIALALSICGRYRCAQAVVEAIFNTIVSEIEQNSSIGKSEESQCEFLTLWLANLAQVSSTRPLGEHGTAMCTDAIARIWVLLEKRLTQLIVRLVYRDILAPKRVARPKLHALFWKMHEWTERVRPFQNHMQRWLFCQTDTCVTQYLDENDCSEIDVTSIMNQIRAFWRQGSFGSGLGYQVDRMVAWDYMNGQNVGPFSPSAVMNRWEMSSTMYDLVEALAAAGRQAQTAELWWEVEDLIHLPWVERLYSGST